MRKTIIIFLFIMLIAKLSFGQDLLNQASEIFNVNIMSIDKVLKLGSSKKGIVIAMWLKNGNVMTKTLKKTKQKESYNGDSARQWNGALGEYDRGNPAYRSSYSDSLTEESINEDIQNSENIWIAYYQMLSKKHGIIIQNEKDVYRKIILSFHIFCE